jgi:hypothetical protein
MGYLIGWLKLAKGTTQSGIKKFFDLGTCPKFDIADKPLSTHDPLNPETIHGSTKASGFLSQSNCFSLLSTDFASCRFLFAWRSWTSRKTGNTCQIHSLGR